MKVLKIVPAIFGVTGLLMLAGATALFLNTRDFIATAAVTEGKVTELVRSRSSDSDTYRPVVVFTTAAGRSVEFTSSSGSNPPSFHRGETVTVLYQPDTPEQARIGSFFSLWGLPMIVGGMGLVFSLVGWGIIASQVLRKRRNQHLRQHGLPVSAEITSVDLDTSFKQNGRSPYRIHAQWQDPGSRKVYVFSSDAIWYDPSDYVAIDEITVYVQRGNPSRYHMDTSFLPPMGDT
ncbi:DUF3592 domain-containing protein [Parahaliea maris]|uniref:DUF3592 domain-containing protein n=1 Tax=Parahaliea maris TaxID=2716870 RepID=A0A5C9A7M0_9GAMM|nr:DUF3592 domain-containing protein [Parahaliea maris]TXS96022.1 DUF3592 domain-containing protein [Parahaliea maris]